MRGPRNRLSRPPNATTPPRSPNRSISSDESGATLALAILEEVDFRERRMSLYTPLANETAVRGVRLGSIQLARDGTQLGSVDVSGE